MTRTSGTPPLVLRRADRLCGIVARVAGSWVVWGG